MAQAGDFDVTDKTPDQLGNQIKLQLQTSLAVAVFKEEGKIFLRILKAKPGEEAKPKGLGKTKKKEKR